MYSELIKSLVSAGFTEGEAKEMLIEKSKEVEQSKTPDKEDDWSEEKEAELEKSCQKANELYEVYKSKRPKNKEEKVVVQKSDENDILKSIESTEFQSKLGDIIKGVVSEMESNFETKLSDIQKSLEIVSELNSDINSIKDKLKTFGNQIQPQKSIIKAEDAILEKASVGGIKQGDYTFMSVKTHKEQICNEISNLMQEKKGTDIEKSLEIDMINYVAGSGNLGQYAKNALKTYKGIEAI